jgi:predicted 3-demethylubiquinone-9 3-methyltransferase (glyoxalase superfamily)
MNNIMKLKKITSILFLSFIVFNCNDLKAERSLNEYMMEQRIIPFLTFQKNDAEEAMNLYISLFDNSKIVEVKRWGKDGPGKEGTIMHAIFDLNGTRFMCSDSPPVHNWDFTPAVSNYVECGNEEEIERLFSKLSERGQVAMPLNNYGFSQKFGWVIDRFGVSWQLNLK